jgi:hypothetical protein
MMKSWLAGLFALMLSACFIGPDGNWATREDIVAAAARCGLPNFAPQRADAAWAAQVSHDVENWRAKEDCIYADLKGQGLSATRYQCLAKPSDPRPNCLDYE